VETRSGSIIFERGRGNGPRNAQQVFNFSQPVTQAVAILSGTNFGFSPKDDHHLGKVTARLDTTIDDDVVIVTGLFGVRDWSGNWDDDYEGSLQFLLLADLEVGAVPSNLQITGAEFNQATQFFRSHLHLDPATARPDNSIPLIAGKNTLVRVYVDTQNDPSRPTVNSVSGVLETRLSGSVNWTPTNPLNGPISPISDGAIRRVNSNDTLNFLIPGAFSTGNLEYRVRVFDAAHPDQPGFTSGRAQGVMRFTSVGPLRIRGIAVNYTGNDSSGNPTNIAAPSLADLLSTLSFVTKTYPVGQVFISGFQTITDGGDYTDTSGDGCGDGWGGLLDRLRDMQGDNADIFYGLVPSGVPLGWGGCGGGDGRVAAGPVGSQQTAAQEISHAFDRDHAPCPPEGQPNAPSDQDSNYPTYDGFMSGSIGEYGLDDAGAVQDPATTTDFMSYCGPQWISPYTYLALRGNFPVVFPSLALFSLQRGEGPADLENLLLKEPHLFLRFRIYRDGEVVVAPSFVYPSHSIERKGKWTPYGVELRDRDDHVLIARRVWRLDRHKNLDNAWLDFTKDLPFPEKTAFVVFTCGEDGCERKELYRLEVPPESPEVKITTPQEAGELKGKVKVSWEVSGGGQTPGQKQPKSGHFVSLVRYSHDGGQNWQAVAPRTTAQELVVDLDQLPGGEQCLFQVLVTGGIRTGSAVSGPFRVPRKPVRVVISPAGSKQVVEQGQPVTLTGIAYSPDTGSLDLNSLEWVSDLQGHLGYGSQITLRQLQAGKHTIYLRGRAPDGSTVEGPVQIEVRESRPKKHTSQTHPGHREKDHKAGSVSKKPEGE